MTVFSGIGDAVLAQTQHREVSGRPAELHPVSRRVDGGGQSAVWAGLQFPRQELPPYPANGNATLSFHVSDQRTHAVIFPCDGLENACSLFGHSFYSFLNNLWPLWCLFQLPDKSISSLVKYYYSWKKTRSRTSLMDRQARKLANRSNQDDRYHPRRFLI